MFRDALSPCTQAATRLQNAGHGVGVGGSPVLLTQFWEINSRVLPTSSSRGASLRVFTRTTEASHGPLPLHLFCVTTPGSSKARVKLSPSVWRWRALLCRSTR